MAVWSIVRIVAEDRSGEIVARASVEGPTMAKHMDRCEVAGIESRVRAMRDPACCASASPPRAEALHRRLRKLSAQTTRPVRVIRVDRLTGIHLPVREGRSTSSTWRCRKREIFGFARPQPRREGDDRRDGDHTGD